ncbi:hypothetical protein LR392_20545 [Arthrobacter sp. AK04]|uniref:hypothetical protein n=1 Tax=Arthrobacter sp. AK04 TaxID=2900048 RepID=UPI001E348624|nr:hypothetical protein [Arthrobacter sp. AK04]MCD5344613.1 hypothetical protein [Arthrobacter sp. AK04]
MATEADVRRIALAMPGVTERLDRIDGKLLAELLQDSYRLAGGERGSRGRPSDP